MFEGTVAALHRWPVKSLRGEEAGAARFDERGMAGDRAHALIDGRERWPELQTHLIDRHANKFGVIMRVTRGE